MRTPQQGPGGPRSVRKPRADAAGVRGAPPLLDDDAGRLVRPYTVCDGRTRPTAHFDLMTLVMATGARPQSYLGPDHTQVLGLCGGPVSVAELAAQIRLPAVVTKVLLSDLADCGAISARAPSRAPLGPDPTDRELLEAVLDGLRKRL
ncbi:MULTISPECIES: DUF742 domain-containing protein [unclassified Streptomyces]|uniref:DUF742 domain-containing protein n=1 Tax=unclassified Streptomyces TaxID=2593676 RepID=UPI002DDBE55F|nr:MULTISPECIES: DUF742 domain-containing protein [unclassified Streptomyces]WSA91060.1 DUF742 domain-containing protein [Streptomyces sp. NBC_01795]WSB75385.1 DUF742 domain-containing protein [Streptomyces sp. NBC_01775]WSS16333.1 DUF742 domain-containing protein [Streptomyces sp. NBC_01186]WSS45150.1 DUF742 domain-containing protein [Streptomyces sp. NBC_01187]